jgi:ABC-type bacteriocin/lantibiotic exporter with double-glycine peptidase domain
MVSVISQTPFCEVDSMKNSIREQEKEDIRRESGDQRSTSAFERNASSQVPFGETRVPLGETQVPLASSSEFESELPKNPSSVFEEDQPPPISKDNIVFQLLYRFFFEEKYVFLGIIVIIFIVNILQTNFISSITSTIIDSMEHKQYSNVYLQYKFFIGVSIIYFMLYTINERFQIHLLTKLTPWLRIEFFKYIMRSNNEELTQQNVMKYNSPINRVSYAATSIITSLISWVISDAAFVIIISGYFLYKNVELGATFLLSNMIVALYVAYNWPSLMYYKNIYEDHLNRNEMDVIDIFNNFDKIIYRGQSEKEIATHNERAEKCIKTSADFQYETSKRQTTVTMFIYIILFSALWYLIRLKTTNRLDTQTFIAFFTILLLYREKLTNILQTIPQFMEFHGRINYVLKSFEDVKGKYSDQKMKTYRPVSLSFDEIRFEKMSYKYQTSETYLFQNLDLTLRTDKPGKVVGLTGMSGKGKSTIMKLLLKLHDYSEGNIYIDGVNIREIAPEYIRENITYVNQSAKLFNMSVIENMMYGCKDSVLCKEYLDIIMKYPAIQHLYRDIDIQSKKAGTLGESLSGGQRQVVNIISGLINPSKILILDEPTNALDLKLKQELLGIIESFRKYKKCIIIITHDRDVYPLFDERIKL